MKNHTVQGGYNVVVVFTDDIESPEGLRSWMVGLFKEGEIFTAYKDWMIKQRESYVLADENPDGICHQHPINKVVAQRLSNSYENPDWF